MNAKEYNHVLINSHFVHMGLLPWKTYGNILKTNEATNKIINTIKLVEKLYH